MSSFTRALVEPTGRTVNGRAEFVVWEGFTYEVGHLGSGWQVTIPAGFLFDGPSVPWWALPIIPVGGLFRASAVHDWLLTTPHPKALADHIFREAMAVEGVAPLTRWACWAAVRVKGR